MGRLFGSQPDDELEDVTSDVYEQEQPHDEIQPQRPAFRFPMITDAEIYGWDEDPEEPVHIKQQVTPLEKKDETSETIPLYKNNRWPAEPPAGEIHRAGNRTKYKEYPEISKKITSKSDKPIERKTEIVKQRANKPFTPTEVPSPVYGFSQPKRAAAKIEHELTSSNGNASITKEVPPANRFLPKDVLPSGRKIVAPSEGIQATNRYMETENEIETETDIDQATEVIEVTEVMEEQCEPTLTELDQSESDFGKLEESSPLSSTTDHPPLDSSHAETLDEETVQTSVQIAVLEPEHDEIQQTITDQEDPVVEVLEEPYEEENLEGFTEPAEPVDEGSEVLYSEANEEGGECIPVVEESTSTLEAEDSKREKIVPFNVVMLKSDKEKQQLRSLAVPNAPSFNEPSKMPVDSRQFSADTKEIQLAKTESQSQSRQHAEAVEPPPLTSLATLSDVPSDEQQVLPHYVFPSIEELLPAELQHEDTEWLTTQSEKLVEALSHFSVEADILEAVQGPTVTRFELTVGFGTKVSKVRNLTDDLKLALAAEDIRIQAPIPGTSSIGIEIPNRTTRPVRISEVIDTDKFTSSDSPLEAVLGLSLTGEPVTIDLRKMPHGMIAGATGSGKSVCINSILVSLLYKASPTELKMMLIDPKMVELAPFNGIPHLISPVITDVKAATAALKWAVDEMERRYELFAHAGARNIERYNQMAEANRQFAQKMPYLLIVIDELADLMMVAPNDVEVSISRIAQKARACGIHLIIATQRPSVDVITGIIKANIPTRIAFAVSSQIDSRTIIDGAGAERLLGRGDMLYVGNGQSSPVRLQGTFVTDDEIECIIDHVKSEASPEYLFGQEDLLAAVVEEEETDPLFTQACSFIIEQGSASTSLMQRHFSIGYNRAAKIMDRMEAHGFISEQRGSRSRDVYLTEADLESFLNPDHEA
ncbi:DNA translocase FtsK [Sporosarcina sp. Sa3CUA8]|uniref:DNA translocase FtsK n=2 Tax=Sporosarcina gallistercoris TaxID=2762245 RepID=A0ABR8PIA8_9BACL|nr:DNA translocase FtsK [Sporosarcina gallistercoris]